MTVNEAIKELELIRDKHGYDVEIIFDCQHCKKETKPERIELVRTKIQAKVI